MNDSAVIDKRFHGAWYTAVYLLAIVLANLSAAHFGPGSTIVNAFLFVGLDLTSRDRLHEAWQGDRLWLKMFCLISAGSLLSWILNRDAAQIALASCVAFLLSGLVDAIAYHALREKSSFVRVNGSNVFSALVDSIAFPTIAFGAFLPIVVIGQFAAKVLGGFMWAEMIGIRRKE